VKGLKVLKAVKAVKTVTTVKVVKEVKLRKHHCNCHCSRLWKRLCGGMSALLQLGWESTLTRPCTILSTKISIKTSAVTRPRRPSEPLEPLEQQEEAATARVQRLLTGL
jgi:hypothetical protein